MTADGPKPDLTPEAWERIGDIFSQAAELDEPERSAFVDEACAGHPHFRTEIIALLGHHQGPAFVDRPSPAAAALNSALGNSAGPSLTEGQVLGGRYRIEALLGTGGMGEVYRALDANSGERIAIKVLRPELAANPSLLRRFQREVPLARRASHAHICPVYDVGVDHQVHYFTMKLVEGETLAQRIRRTGPLPKDEAFRLIVQMAEGLAAAHRSGVIHRDFKCSNVMLSPEGAVITDFGLARFEAKPNADGSGATPASLVSALAPGTITANAQVAGTVAYMSPEQLSGAEVTAASDIYSLGVVLYEMATGGLPFSDSHIIQSAMQRVSGPAPDVRQVAPDLDARWSTAITRCLQRKPGDRFASAQAVAQHIAPSGWRPAMAYWTRRQWTVAASLAAAAALAIGGGWYSLTRPYQPKPEALTWYRQGVQDFHDGSVESARRKLEQAVEADPKFVAAHTYLAAAYSELDSGDLAKREITRAAALEQEVRVTRSDSFRTQAVQRVTASEYDAARAIISQMQASQAPSEFVSGLMDRAWVETRASAYPAAEASLKEVVGRQPRNAGAHYRLGGGYVAQRKQSEALASLTRAEGLFTAASNYDGVCNTLLQRSMFLARSGKAAEAVLIGTRGLEIARSTQDESHEVRLLLALGLAHANAGETVAAKRVTEEAVALASQRKMKHYVASGLLDLGNFHFQREEPDAAESYFRQGLEFATRNQNARNEARARLSLASLYVQYSRFEEAAPLIGPARKFYSDAAVARERSQADILSGRIAVALGETSFAEQVFRDLLLQAKTGADDEQETLIHGYLSDVLFARGDWPEAERERRLMIEQAGSVRGGLRRIGGRVRLAQMLADMGRFREAQAQADLARSDLPLFQGNLKQFSAGLILSDAKASFHQGNWSETIAATTKVNLLVTAGEEGLESRFLACLSRYRLGQLGALADCDKVAASPASRSQPRLAAFGALAVAEALAAKGHGPEAQARALKLMPFFEKGLTEALWRCQAIVDPDRGRSTLAQLASEWPEQLRKSYSARADLPQLSK